MELREFAERVLFSTRLEDKLDGSGRITDEHPGPARDAPAEPGRPPELRFKRAGAGGRGQEFPGLHRLEGARERGRVLHFFANHELLATELMALVLLRFPDAPPAFRRGVLQTLREEQEHTRLYLERMRECGIAFGELPVSGFFWRSVAGMEQPIDYVARLSLTFEQANLDFCREFGRAFAAAGDAQTGRLLERIYQDEIAHVAYGLRWFRRWKDRRLSDWQAYCAQLPEPLSPQRAKGLVLNVEGRRAAGLNAGFIEELDVYSRSKGRTPAVFWFNPFAEGRIASGKAFTPGKHQAQLARDLATLPQFLGRQDDVVLAERPSVGFLQGLKRVGFALPEFMPADEASVRALAGRKLGALRPWAWGPDSLEFLGPLLGSVAGQGRSPESWFNERVAQLYSKAWSAAFLRRVLELERAGAAGNETGDWLCLEEEAGRAVSTMDEALAAISAIRRRGHHRVVVKQAFGLAGHNAIRLWEPDLLPGQRRWLERSLEAGRTLIVEPWLERVVDFSLQLEVRRPGSGPRVVGYAGLSTDVKGQYRGNWAGPDFAKRPPAEAVAALALPGDAEGRVRACYGRILVQLGMELGALGYEGPLGIDAFVYREPGGRCRLKPVVEINPRYTMGRVLVELMSHAAPGTHGLLRLVGLREAEAEAGLEGGHGFEGYARGLLQRWPVRLVGQPVPRIEEGAVCLNDPTRAKVCLAVWQVGPAARIRAAMPCP